ncbi:MAG TPA: anthranilate synthase component I family protein, partial [Chitinophagaceae bacterium]
PPGNRTLSTGPQLRPRLTQEEYLSIIKALQAHIRRGDCYEINFCQEFYHDNAVIDPLAVYQRLSNVSPNPFAAFYRLHDKYLLCESPERYLAMRAGHIIAQPIKGTAKRFVGNEETMARTHFSESAKDRTENVMIVDLVRNDLSKCCEPGSVAVDELFGVYTFPQVYQMISTVSGDLREEVTFEDIIRATFPMGSMTGAPKRRVLELIDHYEPTRRGLFSGAVGYIEPGGDFDFNVVIRSLLYNSTRRYVSVQAGSGITHYSEPLLEWEECLVKAAAMLRALRE